MLFIPREGFRQGGTASASGAGRYGYSTLIALTKPRKPAVIRPRTTMSGTFVDPWAAVAIKQSSPPLKEPRRVLKGITLFNSWNLPGAILAGQQSWQGNTEPISMTFYKNVI